MSTATFTVPLTARVLRAMLADIEGTTAGCGCRAEGVPTPEEQRRYMVVPGPTLGQSITHQQAEQDEPLTSGIVEQGNPFVVPFTLAPEGVVPTAGVTDPFIGQASTPPPVPMPPTQQEGDKGVTTLGTIFPGITVTPPPAPASTVPVDSEGLPWDKRIHASTRTRRVGDDTWKLMKGVDKDLVERVKAELKATMSASGPIAAPPVPETVAHLSGTYTPATGHLIGAPAAAPPAPPVPAAPVATPPPVFSDFVTWVTGKLVAKEFSRDQLQAACAAEGIMSMPMLENRPDLVPAIWKFLESICIPADSVGGA